MRLRAYAKVNLGLDVVRRREDGYHDVKMIMQTLQIYDRLDMELSEEPGICLTANLSFIPTDENNLIYKAAKLLMERCSVQQGVKIHLTKVIPVAAGMAGGSSDAAATLVGLNRLFGLGLSQTELMEIGVKIGADVPYCIMRGTALAEGIGEILTPLAPMPDCYILIGKPAVSVSTPFVYKNLKLNEKTWHPDIDGMMQALERGDLYGITDCMGNVLETVTIPAFPEIELIKQHIKEHGAVNTLMSGSGPTVFGIFDDLQKAEYACEELKKSGLAKQVFLTEPFNIAKDGGTVDDE